MNRRIELEFLEEHSNVTFYTFKYIDIEGDGVTEFDDFMNNFDNETYEDDIDTILYWMEKIGKDGAIDRFFRPEKGNMKALPLDISKLRLYVFKIAENIVLIGNGGLKDTETYNVNPILNSHAENIFSIGKILMSQLNNDKISSYNNILYGLKPISFKAV